MDAEGLAAAVRAASRRPGLVSNYHLDRLVSPAFPLLETPASLVFLDREALHHRLYYLTRDPEDLGRLLGEIAEAPLLVDVLLRERPPYGQGIRAVFEAAGFAHRATFVRMRAEVLSAQGARRPAQPADPALAPAIAALLREAFDERVERIPDAAHVARLAAEGQVFAVGTPARVDAVILYEIEGNACHWRFWVSRPGAHPALAVRVLGEWRADLARRGITRGLLWVNADKPGPAATYERLGFAADGVTVETLARAG